MEEKKRSYVVLYNDMKCELINEVGLTTAMVYLIIKSHKMIENNMHCCYPSNEELYKECDIQKRQFQKHLNKLVDTGWIVVKSGGTKIGRNSNYYFPKEIGMYTEAELNYISKIERRSTKKEEVPAQDNNVADLVGNEDNTNSTDDKIFTPVGKIYDNNLFDEEIEELPPSNNMDTSVGYMEKFYINMNSYYNVNDNTLKNNKTIINKVNSLVGYVEEELINNDIDNIKAEKIINDIMKNNQKNFNNSLNNKSITDDFKKCTYIITCVQNNYKDKKLKTIINNNKIAKLPVVDDGFVDYMNNNYIALPNGENITKEEAIRRIQLNITKDNEKTIFNIIFGVIGRNNKLNNCSIDIIKNVVYKLNNYFGYEILISDRFDGILIEDIPDIAI